MIEKEFKDRVPTYPGRVKMTPVAGQANTYDMERADSPTEAGTPMSKDTFDSMTQSRLTGRYYVPDFSKTESGNYTGITTNPIPTTWIKETSGRAYSGVWVISSSINDNSEVYYAVDGDPNTRWIAAQGASAELIIDAGNVLTVKKMRLHTEAINGTYTSISISGSNNGTDWTTIDTLTNIPKTEIELSLPTTSAFKLYRLSFANSLSNVSASVWTWEFSEYDFKTYINNLTITSGVPIAWTEGQKISIKTPATTDTFAVITNTLNGVNVNTILQPGKLYELRYVGTAFEAKEV
ncbi:MAG: discoidin domain-containing protein [Eubacteriales bacterium]